MYAPVTVHTPTEKRDVTTYGEVVSDCVRCDTYATYIYKEYPL